MTVVLQNGEIYTQQLAHIAETAHFDNSGERTYATHNIVEHIDPTDVVYGCVTKLGSSADLAMLGDEAKILWQARGMDSGENSNTLMLSMTRRPAKKFKAEFLQPARPFVN